MDGADVILAWVVEILEIVSFYHLGGRFVVVVPAAMVILPDVLGGDEFLVSFGKIQLTSTLAFGWRLPRSSAFLRIR